MDATALHLGRLTLGPRSSSQGSLGSLEFGEMPTALAEEVLKSNRYPNSAIPGAENFVITMLRGHRCELFRGAPRL